MCEYTRIECVENGFTLMELKVSTMIVENYMIVYH